MRALNLRARQIPEPFALGAGAVPFEYVVRAATEGIVIATGAQAAGARAILLALSWARGIGGAVAFFARPIDLVVTASRATVTWETAAARRVRVATCSIAKVGKTGAIGGASSITTVSNEAVAGRSTPGTTAARSARRR